MSFDLFKAENDLIESAKAVLGDKAAATKVDMKG